MRPSPDTSGSLPPPEVLDRLGVRVNGHLGGRVHRQWLVSARDRALVLRRCPEPPGDLDYESNVLRRLTELGWPVPAPVDDRFDFGGRTWCLFERLPGAPPIATAGLPKDQRRRGRLLAELHADTRTLTDLGQRAGWHRAEDVVADPGLRRGLDAYAKLFGEPARILRWHADRARERFETLGTDLTDRRPIVLHGDFNARNLLFQDDRLTGIVDFEGTHLNHRVSDFALSWQGKYDDVIAGYEQVHRLDDIDRALLAPTLWSWLFLGVATDIRRMLSGITEPHGFDWQVGRLLRRSTLMGPDAIPYPGSPRSPST